MPRQFRNEDWYWLVGPAPSQVYHSARKAYVALDDALYVAFLADGNLATPIDTEASLRDHLNGAELGYLDEPLPSLVVARPRLPRARGRFAIASLSVPNATPTAVPWSVEVDDPLDIHGAGNPDRILIPEAGVYVAVAGMRWATNATGYRAGQLRVAPSTIVGETAVPAVSGRETSFPVGGEPFQAAKNDILRLFVEQNSGGALDLAARVTLFRFA